MQFNEIRKMAKDLGVSTYKMKKMDIIRAIQNAENNIPCYGTERVDYCGEEGCLWRVACLSLRQS